ncbi:MAG: hypothetical protein J6W31_05910 [Clostridia bacterium]|nr:hypothetical protein [Clostridia bacterium]
MAKEKSLQMTEAEIVKSFREAKDPEAQIGILADLNCVGKTKICEVLLKNGVDADELPKMRGVRVPVDEPTAEERAEMRDAISAGAVPVMVCEKATASPWARAILLCGMIRENDSASTKNGIIALAAEVFLVDACAAYGVAGGAR